MNPERSTQPPRLPIRKRHPSAILLLAASAMIAATGDADGQEMAAGSELSVASHIPSTAADPAGHVTAIDRNDIELSGMKNISDLLLSRLGYNSFGLYRPFVLGSGRTAVLVNGRRVSDSSFDLDALPISAVERIEILSGSAAALHGGHAIGGAVNIVLRRDHEGAEVQVSADRPTGAGGDAEHGSALWGGPLGDGHVVLGTDAFQREEIRNADRDYSRASWTPGGSFADTAGVSTGGNTIFIPNASGTSIAHSLGDCQGSAYTGVLTEPRSFSGEGCGFAWADIAWGTERLERKSLYINLDHPLGEDADIYADARVAQGDTAFRYAPSVGDFSFKPSEALARELLQHHPEIGELPERVRVAHRFVGHGNRDWRTDLEEYDLTLGVQGRSAGGIGYDAHLRYYLHDAVESGDTFVSMSAIQRAVEEGRYDIENPFSTDPEHLAAIRESGLRLTRDQVTDHKTARASLDGAAFKLGGGDVRWAAGAEVAYEDWRDLYDYRDIDNRSYKAIDVLGSAGNSASGERRRWSAFTEVSLPLRNGWDVVLAGRRDDHDDVGAAFSHEVASRYRLHEALTIRSSWGGGSRAPSLYALHARESLDYPRICDTGTLTGDPENCDVYQVERASGGNPRLKPDEAESFSLGVAASLGSISLSADWFRIGLSDMPARLSAQSIIDLDLEGRLPPGAAVIREAGLITRIESPLVNSGETDVAGLDLRARADWNASWADMVLDARWLHTTRYGHRVAGEIQPGDYPRNRVHASLRATRGDFTANWSAYAVSGRWNLRETAATRRGRGTMSRSAGAMRSARGGWTSPEAFSTSAIAVRPPIPRFPAWTARTRRWIPSGGARCF